MWVALYGEGENWETMTWITLEAEQTFGIQSTRDEVWLWVNAHVARRAEPLRVLTAKIEGILRCG